MVRKVRSLEDHRRILVRKARVYASQGHDHLAEVHINEALRRGEPLEQVNEGLEGLGSALISRRKALQTTAALAGAGYASLYLPSSGAAAVAAAEGAVPERASPSHYLSVPELDGSGTHRIMSLSAAGLEELAGRWSGESFVDASGRLVNVGQAWRGGTAQTTVSGVDSDGTVRRFALPEIRGNHADDQLTRTLVAARGSYLVCAHILGRIYGASARAKGHGSRVGVTSQHVIEVSDLRSGSLVDRWVGPAMEGACHIGLAVRDDAAEMLLSVDLPVGSPARWVTSFSFDGSALRVREQFTPADRAFFYGLMTPYYDWPAEQGSQLRQVGNNAVNRYDPRTGSQRREELPFKYGDNRQPPAYQGLFRRAASGLAASGSGTVVPVDADDGHVRLLPGGLPFFVYSARAVRELLAGGPDGSAWVIDNREGSGGVWRLDARNNPTDHLLRGSYLAGCAMDVGGGSIALSNPLESVVHVIDTATHAQRVVAVPKTAALLTRR